ncbi:DUF2867 domain-containing protein [Peteryoungia desertarenae]|uniref:DUF2867 domain-containing protein n=1 Tax=Peteryoungia desertarenae TaxID=1813451 RepID=A0ABX6QJB1_9HYPH|nr:DUF2867 domain-containing protein [Peteryoungia desertarenae]QLF68654.1 DUF2867 domain-containing protein [Peteryoungia desertarenae]
MGAVESLEVRLPHPDLPAGDWADSYAVSVSRVDLVALDVAKSMFGDVPRWVRTLLAFRNRIVSLVGLKSAELKMTGRESIGGFPLLASTGDQALLGFDDWHLDFRILISVEKISGGRQRVRVTTLVKRHNLFGRIYIFVVTPFHRLIVRSFLRRFLAAQMVIRQPV